MIDESPLANSPAKPPLPCSRSTPTPTPQHIRSTWCPTQGLLSLSTLLEWEGAPMGDTQNLPRHLSFQMAGGTVGQGPWLLILGWALAAASTLKSRCGGGVRNLWNVWMRG